MEDYKSTIPWLEGSLVSRTVRHPLLNLFQFLPFSIADYGEKNLMDITKLTFQLCLYSDLHEKWMAGTDMHTSLSLYLPLDYHFSKALQKVSAVNRHISIFL